MAQRASLYTPCSTRAVRFFLVRSVMNTLWRLGKTKRPGTESPKELAPVEWPPLRSLGDFATEATFTAPHTDDELLARRLWRNVEYLLRTIYMRHFQF